MVVRPLMGTDEGRDEGGAVNDVALNRKSVLAISALNERTEWADVVLRCVFVHKDSSLRHRSDCGALGETTRSLISDTPYNQVRRLWGRRSGGRPQAPLMLRLSRDEMAH